MHFSGIRNRNLSLEKKKQENDIKGVSITSSSPYPVVSNICGLSLLWSPDSIGPTKIVHRKNNGGKRNLVANLEDSHTIIRGKLPKVHSTIKDKINQLWISYAKFQL